MHNMMIRQGLFVLKNALKNRRLKIGFLGGSITENRVPHNWPEVVTRFFLTEYPDLRLSIENAAIGATGSDFGLVRVRKDIIDKDCDLVFLEYAVNDFYTLSKRRIDQMEGIIRRIKEESRSDIILVYTYLQDMQPDLLNEKMPQIIQEYEQLADYYHINSIFVGKIAFDEVRKGLSRYEEWLPDGLHPQYRGSQIYGQAVIDLIKKSLLSDKKIAQTPHLPLSNTNWQNAISIEFDQLDIRAPFFIKRCSTQAFVQDVIYTSAIGATLTIPYEGRGLLLVFDFGKRSSEFKYRIDSKEWADVVRDRPSWVGLSGWLRPYLIGENLEKGHHRVEIMVTHGLRPDCEGTNFELTHILALQ